MATIGARLAGRRVLAAEYDGTFVRTFIRSQVTTCCKTPVERGASPLSPSFLTQMSIVDGDTRHPMKIDHDEQVRLGIDIELDGLASYEGTQSNCMFQLALMLARIAIEPCAEAYKEETAQALMGLIRAKPKCNVVTLFGNRPKVDTGGSGLRAAG